MQLQEAGVKRDRVTEIYGTVRGSNPGEGEIFHTRPDRHCGPPSLLIHNWYRDIPGDKAAGAWRKPPTAI